MFQHVRGRAASIALTRHPWFPAQAPWCFRSPAAAVTQSGSAPLRFLKTMLKTIAEPQGFLKTIYESYCSGAEIPENHC